jgi:hypothetical protein
MCPGLRVSARTHLDIHIGNFQIHVTSGIAGWLEQKRQGHDDMQRLRSKREPN